MSSYLLSETEIIEIVNYINNYRKKHNALELKYDEELSKDAKDSAISMLKKKEINYNINNEYSEVLYSSWACRNQKMLFTNNARIRCSFSII